MTFIFYHYAAETWPTTVANTKKLQAAHHCMVTEKLLRIRWKDTGTYVKVLQRTGMIKMENILYKRDYDG